MNQLTSFLQRETITAYWLIRRHWWQALLVASIMGCGLLSAFAPRLLQFPYAANNVEALLTLLVIASPFLLLLAWVLPVDWDFRFEPIDLAYGATIVVTMLSFFWTWGAFQPTRPFFNVFALFYFYLLVRVLGRRVLLRNLTLIAALVAAVAGAEALGGLIQRSAGLAMKGHFENSNALGMFLALAVPIALSQVGTRVYGLFYRFHFGALTVLFLWAITLTRCRTAIVALACVLPLMLLFHCRGLLFLLSRRAYFWIISGILFATVSGLALLASPLYELRPVSVWGRVLAWKMGLQMLRDFPLFGVGFDRASRLLMEYQARYFSSGGGNDLERLASSPVTSLFNDHLETAVDFGFAGLVVFALFWYMILKTAFRLLVPPAVDYTSDLRSKPSGRPAATLFASVLGGVDRRTAGFGFAGTILLFMLMSFSYCTSHFRILMVTFNLSLALAVGFLSARQPAGGERAGPEQAAL